MPFQAQHPCMHGMPTHHAAAGHQGRLLQHNTCSTTLSSPPPHTATAKVLAVSIPKHHQHPKRAHSDSRQTKHPATQEQTSRARTTRNYRVQHLQGGKATAHTPPPARQHAESERQSEEKKQCSKHPTLTPFAKGKGQHWRHHRLTHAHLTASCAP